MLKYLIYLLIITVTLGCRKSKDETTIEFVVVNDITGEPFAGVEVKIFETANKHKPHSELFWEGTTNSNGKVTHTFRALKKSMITYDFSANLQKLADDVGYSFEIFTAPFPGQIKKNEHNVLEYRLRPMGFLKYSRINSNCEGSTDTTWVYYNIPCFEPFLSNPIVGCSDNVAQGYTSVCMGTYTYTYRIKRSNLDSTFTKSFFLKPGEYYDFVVEY